MQAVSLWQVGTGRSRGELQRQAKPPAAPFHSLPPKTKRDIDLQPAA